MLWPTDSYVLRYDDSCCYLGTNMEPLYIVAIVLLSANEVATHIL
jgi:hypothetical protein